MITESKKTLFIRLMAFVLVVLIPFQIYMDIYGNISITVAECLLLVLLIFIAFWLHSPIRLLAIPGRTTILLLLFIGSMIISSLLASDPSVSVKYTIKWSALFTAYFVFYWVLRIAGQVEDILSTYVLTGCIITLMGTSFFIFGPQGLQEFLRSPAASLFIDPSTIQYGDINWFRGGGTGGTFFNRNWYAAFIGMIIPYCLIRAVLIAKGRFYWGIASFVLISGLLISLSRGGWLGFFSFILVWLYMQKKHFWRVSAIIMVMIIILGGGVVLFFSRSLGESIRTDSNGARC